MTNHELAVKLLELVGGKENVISAANCMTRLRVKLRDNAKAQIQAIKETEGVLGVVEDKTLQIVLGPGKAKKVGDEFAPLAGTTLGAAQDVTDDWQANKQNIKQGQKQNRFKDGIRNIADIFIPLIPAVIGAGLLSGFASLLSNTGFGKLAMASGAQALAAVAETGGSALSHFPSTGQLLFYLLIVMMQLLSGAFLGYFAIFTGVNAAKQFGGTPGLGGMLGAVSIMAQIDTLSQIFGWFDYSSRLDSVLITGKGGLIGVILGVWIMCKIEKWLHKHIPDTLDLIFVPILTLLASGIIFVFGIMPLAGVLSDGLVFVLKFLIESSNFVVRIISGYVLAAVFLPMVLLGLHHGLVPIYSVQLETYQALHGIAGGVTLFPILAMAGAGQVGAALAIYRKASQLKNNRLKQTIIGALPAGFLGVGEPLIYGVTLPMGKPFISAGLGAGFGGAFCAATNVAATAWGPSGLVAIPLMETPAKMLFFLIGLVIAYIMGFIITAAMIKDEDVQAV